MVQILFLNIKQQIRIAMPNTYTKLYIHIIFSVKNREPLINPSFEQELHKYITGIIKNREQKLIAINGTSNHIHLLIGLKPEMAISNLVRDIKVNSTNFINDRKLSKTKFGWQTGFGAFSYGHSQISDVANYIKRQKKTSSQENI